MVSVVWIECGSAIFLDGPAIWHGGTACGDGQTTGDGVNLPLPPFWAATMIIVLFDSPPSTLNVSVVDNRLSR